MWNFLNNLPLAFALLVLLAFPTLANSQGYDLHTQNYGYADPAIDYNYEKQKMPTIFDTYISAKLDAVFNISNKTQTIQRSNGANINNNVELEEGIGIDVAFGANLLSPNITIEVETGIIQFDLENVVNQTEVFNQDQPIWNVMFNGYYHIKNQTSFTPYVGFGLGAVGLIRSYETGFGCQFMTGIEYKINQKLNAIVGYKYFDTADISVKPRDTFTPSYDETISITTHALQLGLKYKF